MNISEFIINALEQEGVTRIYGVPGEENEDFLFALEHSDIEFVNCRHEQGAAFMANVHGRITGQAGVCLSTLGPGATNLLTGLADAQLDKAPVVAITAQGGLDRLHHESHQIIDISQMMEPITKMNHFIKDITTTPEVIRRAFKMAQSEKPGVSHIELPESIAADDATHLTVLKPKAFRMASPDPKSLNAAKSLIQEAQKPLIIAGNGAIRNRASHALTQFSTDYNIPVTSTFMGKGAVSDKSTQSLRSIGLGFKDYIIEAAEESDLIITIGYDIAEYDPANWNIGHKKQIIHIDFEPAEVYTEYQPSIEIVADIEGSINALRELLTIDETPAYPSWYEDIQQRIIDDIEGYTLPDDSTHFTVPAVINAVRSEMDDSGLLISDVGAHKMWIARNYQTYCPNGTIISNGLASMGISLPGGLSASLQQPDRTIISMMGDGGFLMNVQELETAKRTNAKYGIVVFVNDDYGLISWKQERSKGKSFGTTFTNPNFHLLGESFGIPVKQPENIKDLKAIIRSLNDQPELVLIPIPVSDHVNAELTNKLSKYYAK